MKSSSLNRTLHFTNIYWNKRVGSIFNILRTNLFSNHIYFPVILWIRLKSFLRKPPLLVWFISKTHIRKWGIPLYLFSCLLMRKMYLLLRKLMISYWRSILGFALVVIFRYYSFVRLPFWLLLMRLRFLGLFFIFWCLPAVIIIRMICIL